MDRINRFIHAIASAGAEYLFHTTAPAFYEPCQIEYMGDPRIVRFGVVLAQQIIHRPIVRQAWFECKCGYWIFSTSSVCTNMGGAFVS